MRESFPIDPALKLKPRAPSIAQALSRNGWEAYTLFKGRINSSRRQQLHMPGKFRVCQIADALAEGDKHGIVLDR